MVIEDCSAFRRLNPPEDGILTLGIFSSIAAAAKTQFRVLRPETLRPFSRIPLRSRLYARLSEHRRDAIRRKTPYRKAGRIAN